MPALKKVSSLDLLYGIQNKPGTPIDDVISNRYGNYASAFNSWKV